MNVYIVMMRGIDESDEVLHVCLDEERANKIAHAEALDSDYGIDVVQFPVTE